MSHRFYQLLESITQGKFISLHDCVESLTLRDQDLIPVVTECYQSQEVLMRFDYDGDTILC